MFESLFSDLARSQSASHKERQHCKMDQHWDPFSAEGADSRHSSLGHQTIRFELTSGLKVDIQVQVNGQPLEAALPTPQGEPEEAAFSTSHSNRFIRLSDKGDPALALALRVLNQLIHTTQPSELVTTLIYFRESPKALNLARAYLPQAAHNIECGIRQFISSACFELSSPATFISGAKKINLLGHLPNGMEQFAPELSLNFRHAATTALQGFLASTFHKLGVDLFKEIYGTFVLKWISPEELVSVVRRAIRVLCGAASNQRIDPFSTCLFAALHSLLSEKSHLSSLIVLIEELRTECTHRASFACWLLVVDQVRLQFCEGAFPPEVEEILTLPPKEKQWYFPPSEATTNADRSTCFSWRASNKD